MKCVFCGSELPPGARFCGGCGSLVDAAVPANEATSRSEAASVSNTVQEEQQRQAMLGTPPPIPPAYTQFGSQGAATPVSPYAQFGQTLQDPYYQPSPYEATPAPVSATPLPPPHYKQANAPRKGPGTATKVLIGVICAVVVLGAAGTALVIYLLSRPQPVITLNSAYSVNGTPAGSAGTVLRVSGQKFSSSSAITFLLDGSPAPGNQSVQSDASGNISVNLAITSGWPVGSHTLTARDASNYTTRSGVTVMIVQQGEANTPGPRGAPANDASFKLNINVNGTLQANGQSFSNQDTMLVTGKPDPAGGTACLSVDDGQTHVFNETTVNSSQGYRETSIYSCNGSYKTGKITYTETLTSDVIVYNSNGATCTLSAPHVDLQLTGDYSGNNAFSGTATYPGITSYNCNLPGAYFFHYAAQGTWTGRVQ
ncbi:MAG TPA: zinc ribbon domain-containing protein [Ktedonobacteraceae bacterium]|nr:zinc ribbon domain-containing protein [Ktedonobacteraceae bacterium]